MPTRIDDPLENRLDQVLLVFRVEVTQNRRFSDVPIVGHSGPEQSPILGGVVPIETDSLPLALG